MKHLPKSLRPAILAAGIASLLQITVPGADAALTFLGVAAGDATSTDAIVWTRATDSANPTGSTPLTLNISTDPTLTTGVTSLSNGVATDPTHDFTCKVPVSALTPGTVYYYQFVGIGGDKSNIGKFKTPPAPTTSAPLHFAFSGDYDGLMRPYTLGKNFTTNTFDFFMNVGDTIYETASTGSPAVAATGPFSAGTGYPTTTPATSAGATGSTLYADFTRKYREQFIAINAGGQNCLQDFFAAQGNYTLLDNHELGNKQYMHGGAPAGTAIGDFTTGAGADPAVTTNDVNTTGTFINKTGGFAKLIQAYMDYQPVKNRGLITAPSDPRTDGTQQLYMSQQWGKNALLINTDTRSYRDLRMRTAGNADDNGSRADNANRTYFGATQLAWIESTLQNAENAGTLWKFVVISDPIDQIGPIGGTLPVTATSMQPYSGNPAYGPVNSDGGKALMGGYRAERNALLKYIADHQIKNVVFLTTDDHQNRINEVLYSPTGQTGVQSSYVKVPYCFEIVDGPFGATGPDLFLNHDWNSVKGAANLIANAQIAAGVNPIGLESYPGLHDVKRDQDGVLVSESVPQAADFYSPDTFNYNTLDLSADGKTLTVTGVGINSYAQNNRVEAGTGNQATNSPRTIFQFQVDAASALDSIDHIVVIYQENWSFDGLYGSFPGANGIANATTSSLNQLDRLTAASLSSETGANAFNRISQTGNTPNLPLVSSTTNTNSNPGTLNNPPQPLGSPTGASVIDTRLSSNPSDPTSALTVNTLAPYLLPPAVNPTDLTGDIVHRYWHEQFQIAGAGSSGGTDFVTKNGGNFVNAGFITWSDNPGLCMSRFDATSLPEGLLAQQFTMCDNFYHSAFGGSFLNHQFLVAAAAPVYDSMPTSNNGNIAYLDANGLLVLNTSGPSAGKQVQDGNITPVGGENLTVTLNGTPSTAVTANSVAFVDGSTFGKHYAVNTIRSKNLTGNGENPAAASTLPSLNDSNPSDGTRTYSPTIGDLLSASNVSWKWYSGAWDTIKAYSGSNPTPTTSPSYSSVNASLQMQYHHQAFAYYDNYAPFDTTNTVPPAYIGGFAGYQPVALTPGQSGVTRAQNSAAHLQDETHFFDDVTNGTLPAVSFIKPVGVNNEHPGYAALQTGQAHVASIVQALQANPALWAHTAVIVTYDEHGGRWDHATPPVRDIWGPGVRVPTLVISPLAKKGYVDHASRDTSSILTTIEQRFGLPALNQRDASAASFADVFTSLEINRGGFTRDRRTGTFAQVVTVTNRANTPIVGPIQLVLDNVNATLVNSAGTTTNNAPSGSPFVTVFTGSLAPGASASFTLQFTPPGSGGITYSARTVTGTSNP